MSCFRIDEALANPFYDGSLDHDTSRWLNDAYLSTCFDEFNTRFFQGVLKKPVLHCCSKTEEDFEDGLGVTVYDFVDCFGTPCDEVDLNSIRQGDVFRYVRGVFLRNDVKWSSRFQFENALIHEMCHVYQNDIVLKRDLYAIIKDSETSLRWNQKDRFHGDAFLGIAKKVSNHPENEEWFEVTPYVLGDEIIREFRMFRDTNDSDKTHRDSRRHYEVTSRDIPNLSDRRSNARSRSSNIVARYQSFNKEKGEIRYNVTSQTKAGKSYTVSFRFKNWHPDMNHLDDEIQHSMKGDIEIDCTCPAFEFQGYKYLATLKGGSIEAERRPPNKTNRDRHGFACKHILKAIDSFNQDFDKFRSEGKGVIRKRNLRVQHKYERNGNVRRYGRTRNESTASLGEMIYRDIASDLNKFISDAQEMFEDILVNSYGFSRVKAYIDIVDGLESDDGYFVICATLYDRMDNTVDEITYEFRPDGIYDDSDDFICDRREQLCESIANRFADTWDYENAGR